MKYNSLAAVKERIALDQLRESFESISDDFRRRTAMLDGKVKELQRARLGDRFAFACVILIVSTFWWGCGHWTGFQKGEERAKVRFAKSVQVEQQP